MLKRLFVTTAMALQGASLCLAQVPAPPSVPASNPHLTYDQKFRACQILATNQGLTGEPRRAFIAQCVLA
jgi:hypothetical protein